MFYIGIDWADDHHVLFATNESADNLISFRISHKLEGFQSLLNKVQSLSHDKDQIIFAIESNQGLLVVFILDTGYKVYPINPKSMDRYRDRYKVSGAKNYRFDAKVLEISFVQIYLP